MGKVTIYLPDDLERILKGLAKEERRSLSSQIVYLVERELKRKK